MGGEVADNPTQKALSGSADGPIADAKARRRTHGWLSSILFLAVAVGAVGLWFSLAQLVGWIVSVGITGVAAGTLAGVMAVRSNPRPSEPLLVTDEMTDVRQAGWEMLQAEVTRSRRYGHSLVLVAIPEDVWLSSDLQIGPAQQALEATRAVEPLLRSSDHAWFDGSTIYIMLAECQSDQARHFLARARSSLPALFPSGGRLGYAAFPAHAVTVGGLLDALQPLDLDELEPKAA
jgi:hypothetical protein